MISHDYKCIFIHIPKCAGTSIERALGHFDGHSGRGGQDHRPIRMIEKPALNIHTLSSIDNLLQFRSSFKHRNSNQVSNPKNKNEVTSKQYKIYFKFTVVRNPWSRAFSWYKNVMRDEMHQRNNGITSDITFSSFLENFMGKGMLRPQLYWLKEYSGNINFDHIGKFERLEETFDVIKKNLNVSDINFPHEIKGNGDDYKSHYNQDLIDKVGKFYSKEIKFFGYSFNS